MTDEKRTTVSSTKDYRVYDPALPENFGDALGRAPEKAHSTEWVRADPDHIASIIEDELHNAAFMKDEARALAERAAARICGRGSEER